MVSGGTVFDDVDIVLNFEELYNRYGPMVFRRCKKLLGSEQEAHEVMQDVFVQIYKKLDQLDLSKPSSLLYTIATNLSLNKLRSRKRKPETDNEKVLMFIASEDNIENRVIWRSFLGQIFDREKPSTQLIATLHYVDRMTLEEVASTVDMSVSGVRKRLRNLRSNAIEFLEEAHATSNI